MKRILNHKEAASSPTSAAEVPTPRRHLASRLDRCRTRNSDVLVSYADLYLFLASLKNSSVFRITIIFIATYYFTLLLLLLLPLLLPLQLFSLLFIMNLILYYYNYYHYCYHYHNYNYLHSYH